MLTIRHATLFSLTALAAVALLPAGRAGAGCLAPLDTLIDENNAGGLLAANDAGSLLYSRLENTGEMALIRQLPDGTRDFVGVEGQSTSFLVGAEDEEWSTFRDGSINADDDVAFVAETRPEGGVGLAAVFAQRGNSLFRIARRGGDSPFLGGSGQPLKWGSFFDARALARTEGGQFGAIFRGEVVVPVPPPDFPILRGGLFRWDEETGMITTLVNEGDPAPSGGTFSSVIRTRANALGDVIFYGLTDVGGNESGGLFLQPDGGSSVRVVKFGSAGDPAPGGGSFGLVGDFDLDDQGVLWFAATLTGGSVGDGLFRAAPPNYLPERVAAGGDTTPLGGTYETFATATLRVGGAGELVMRVELSEDLEGDGIFTVDAGMPVVRPLGITDDVLTVAATGTGRMVYKTRTELHQLVAADGSDEGPTDFRVVRADLRNPAGLRADGIVLETRFQLPPVGDGEGETAPAVFRADGNERETVDGIVSGANLLRITEVKVALDDGPGNNFVFALTGDGNRPPASMTFNDVAQPDPRAALNRGGDACTWRFNSPIGAGIFQVDLTRGVARMRLARGALQGGFAARDVPVTLTLRSSDDVAGSVADEDSFFHRSISVDGTQTPFRNGTRFFTTAETVDGGTLFVDQLTVRRALRVRRGSSDPEALNDTVILRGTLRLCPGSTNPTTPGLAASFRIGDVMLDDLTLDRFGRGAKYRYRERSAELGNVSVLVDVDRGTFLIRIVRGPVNSQLVNADFTRGASVNGVRSEVRGMELPFSANIARVYEASFDVPVVRRRGARVFVR